MPLRYPPEWKFEPTDESIPAEAISELLDLILKIVDGDPERWTALKRFKSAFGDSSPSTSESWAESDLATAMHETADYCVAFIDSLWQGIEATDEAGIPVPRPKVINEILAKHGIPFKIAPPDLVRRKGDAQVVETESEQTTSTAYYARHESIGRGGFGTVYRVTRKTSIGEFEYAMKVLDPSPFMQNLDRAKERFAREVEILRTLQHRGIVQHLEAGMDQDDKPYILMPLIEGADLRQATEGATLAHILYLFEQIASALEYAHSQNVIHRDLKPTNILVRSTDHQPVVLDFGCGFLLDSADSHTLTTTLVGSLGYIPSEVQVNPKLRDPKQDVYAYGVTLYEVIARCLPDRDDYKPLAEIRPEFESVDAVVTRAIAPAKRRISSAADLHQEIEKLSLGIQDD